MFNFSKPANRPRPPSEQQIQVLTDLENHDRPGHSRMPCPRDLRSQPQQLSPHMRECTDVVHHSHDLRDDDDAASQLFSLHEPFLATPAARAKRMRSCADSDTASSSCRDCDEPEVVAPDSVPALVNDVKRMLEYVSSKPSLQAGSASFLRDYLRTMLLQNAHSATEAIQAANKAHRVEVTAGRRKSREPFKRIPDEIAKHVFGFLSGRDLARAREVCKRWNDFANEERLWKRLCLQNWKSLETDLALWRVLDNKLSLDDPHCWRNIYPKVEKTPKWTCRLQKTGRFICNLVAHQISGTPIGDAGLPNVLVVERRFNIVHLRTFILNDASILYYEPESEEDRHGFNEFIEYLNKRTRAGLALEEQRRFIFIPPCDYTRTHVDYHGHSLLGVVQNAYNPLGPL
ncbi:unnamed protein product [Agarophyton chilense]